jgi:hypothetical protein
MAFNDLRIEERCVETAAMQKCDTCSNPKVGYGRRVSIAFSYSKGQ